MIEPEMAFTEIEGNAAVAEDFLQSVVKMILDRCAADIAFLDQRVQPEPTRQPGAGGYHPSTLNDRTRRRSIC